MIVGINARILDAETIRGWSRYAYNLIKGLEKKGVGLKLFSDRPLNLRAIPQSLHKNIVIKSGRNYVHWEQIVLKQMAEEHSVDILHCPINYGLPLMGNFKKVLTLHDAIEKSFYDQLKNPIEKLKYPHLKSRALHYISQYSADSIITVSEFAKKDIISSYGLKANKISVVYEAADSNFNDTNIKSKEDLNSKWGIEPGYLLYVGGLEARKNIPFLVAMANKLPQYNFVIVGGGDISKYRDTGVNFFSLGYVDEEWLPSMYHHSKAFIYPSFHEGFGLQLVESLRMERPAIYSNTSSLPEIYGSAEFGFNPNDVDEAIEKLYLLERKYKEAIEYVKSRKRFFSWEKTIESTILIYDSLLKK